MHSLNDENDKCVTTNLCSGGGGGGEFNGTHAHLSPNFSFSSDFGHFILKVLENAFFYLCQEKDTEISKFLGTSPSATEYLKKLNKTSSISSVKWSSANTTDRKSVKNTLTSTLNNRLNNVALGVFNQHFQKYMSYDLCL